MNQHPIYALLQSGPPPLHTGILMLTERGSWAIGECDAWQHDGKSGIQFNDQAWHCQFTVGKDHWMLLPSPSNGP